MSWIASLGLQMTRIWIAATLLLIAACRDERPPAPTPEQSSQLNQAEDMLNDLAQNEEGPADRSASPSNPTK